VHIGIRTISLSSTKLSDNRINSHVGLTYHHFIIHRIVVIVVLIVIIVVLIPSNVIENSVVCVNIGGTSRKSRTIATRSLHRCLECSTCVQALLGFLLRMMVQANFRRWWRIVTTIQHDVSPDDGSGRESVEVHYGCGTVAQVGASISAPATTT